MSELRDLSEQVQLLTVNEVPDVIGGQVKTWQELALVWAEVRPASATRGTRIGGTTTRRFVKIFIRERNDLILPLRVNWAGANLDVLAVRTMQNGRVELECEQVFQ